MDYHYLGHQVLGYRKQRGLTQAQLAEEVDVSTAFIGHVERGTRKPSLDTVVALAQALHVSIDTLALPPQSQVKVADYSAEQLAAAGTLLETALKMTMAREKD